MKLIIKMDKTKVDASQFSIPDDHQRSSKRKKHGTSNSLNLNTSGNDHVRETDQDCGRIKRKCEEIRKELCEIQALEMSLEEERDALKMQKAQLQEELQRSKRNEQQLQEDLVASRRNTQEAIAQLQGDLNNSMREKEEARRSQISVESKLLQLKTIIQHDITPLIMDSSFVSTLTPSPSQENVQESSQESVPEALVEVTLDNDTISQEELYSQGIQFSETTVEIQTTTPGTYTDRDRVVLREEVKSAGEPEEGQQMEKDIISSLHEDAGDVEMADLSGVSLIGGLPLVAPDHSSTLLDNGRDEAQEA